MPGTSPATVVSDVRLSTPNVALGPWRSIPIDLTTAKTNANPPAILTGLTTPAATLASNSFSLKYTSSLTGTTAFLLTTTLPHDAQDFDTASASPYTRGAMVKLVGKARVANAAETAIPAATIYAQGVGTYDNSSDTTASTKALSAAFTGTFRRIDRATSRVVSTTAMSQAANAVDFFELDFSDALDSGSLRIQPGDTLTILVALSGTSVGNFDFLGLELWYRTNLDVTNRKLR